MAEAVLSPTGRTAVMDFYNDNDRVAAEWMRELIREKHLPNGVVDERSIKEIEGAELRRFRRVHLFAGIGGWAYALRLAGWPATRPVWTGSCPCQPFSAAGKRRGEADERHLWPVFLRLVRQCNPPAIFGEQVASGDGYQWLARVRDDLEEAGYAVGCADLPACCAGSPIIRQRLWWVAIAASPRPAATATANEKSKCGRIKFGREGRTAPRWLSGTDGSEFRRQPSTWNEPGNRENEVLLCTDGKYRRTQSQLYPLAARLPGTVAYMRGYGNSIVPAVAAAFVRAFLDSE